MSPLASCTPDIAGQAHNVKIGDQVAVRIDDDRGADAGVGAKPAGRTTCFQAAGVDIGDRRRGDIDGVGIARRLPGTACIVAIHDRQQVRPDQHDDKRGCQADDHGLGQENQNGFDAWHVQFFGVVAIRLDATL